MKLKFLILPLFLGIVGCVSNLDLDQKSPLSEGDFSRLIEQLEGRACYWDSSGRVIDHIAMNLPVPSMGADVEFDCQVEAANVLRTYARRGKQHLRSAVPSLIRSLSYRKKQKNEYSSDYYYFSLQFRAAEVLGAIKDPRAIDGLLKVIKSNHQCLSNASSPDCEPLLYFKQGLYESHYECLTNKAWEDLCDPQKYRHRRLVDRQTQAIDALGEIGVSRSDIVELLMEGLKNKSEDFRSSSVLSLAKLKVDRAIDPIISIFQRDQSKSVRISAAKALGIFGKSAQKTIPLLTLSVKSGDSTADEAAYALWKINTPKSINAIKELAKNNNPKVRNIANQPCEDLEEIENSRKSR
jgi:HEAT repeat protein